MDTPRKPTTPPRQDERLGMNEPISRRDFVNGTLAAGAGLLLHGRLPNELPRVDGWTGYGGVGDYRRSNGNTREVMDAAHLMRDGVFDRSSRGPRTRVRSTIW